MVACDGAQGYDSAQKSLRPLANADAAAEELFAPNPPATLVTVRQCDHRDANTSSGAESLISCPCNEPRGTLCTGGLALVCEDRRWQVTHSAACAVPGVLSCQGVFDDLTACFAQFAECFPYTAHDDATLYCGTAALVSACDGGIWIAAKTPTVTPAPSPRGAAAHEDMAKSEAQDRSHQTRAQCEPGCPAPYLLRPVVCGDSGCFPYSETLGLVCDLPRYPTLTECLLAKGHKIEHSLAEAGVPGADYGCAEGQLLGLIGELGAETQSCCKNPG